MLRRILYLHEGELARLWPFFLLYLILFAAFSVADGVSQAWFVQLVGPSRLPLAYGFVAIANLIMMALYIPLAERVGAIGTFVAIIGGAILVFGAAWAWLSLEAGSLGWYGVLYAAREIGFTLMLMHFGTFLNDFFTRAELNRVLPLVYSGGRVGGIVGGAILHQLAEPLGLIHLLGLFVLLCVIALFVVILLARCMVHVQHPEDHSSDAGVAGAGSELETRARSSFLAFLHYVWASPLLFWITVASVLFILCRWNLNFQYSHFFASYFDDEREMARFLGLYTQLALIGSLIVQVLIVNRLVAWLGLKGAHLIYGVLLAGSMTLCLGKMTLGLAVFARLMESELRFGLRNPIMQLITNKFAKGLRVRVRAWSLGMVIPLATLLSSLLLGMMLHWGEAAWIPWLGAACSAGHLLGSIALVRSFSEKKTMPTEEEPIPFPADAEIVEPEGRKG